MRIIDATARIARIPAVPAAILLLSCILLFASSSLAGVENIPLHSWEVEALEKLLAYSGIPYPTTTLPLNRLEVAGLLVQMEDDPELEPLFAGNRTFRGIFELLAERVAREMDYLRKGRRDGKFDWSLRVLDRAEVHAGATDADGPYAKLPGGERDGSLRAGISLAHSLTLEENLGLYIEEDATGTWIPSQETAEAELSLVRGYLKFVAWNVELLAGRDGLWWGPGYHGTLMLSDNAPEFDMVKLSSFRPFLLPWVFKYAGRIRLAAFLTRLEEDRVVPRPYLAGMRGTVSPTGYLDLGVTRTVMFGGEGRPTPLVSDIPTILLGQKEHSWGSRVDTNQLANLDARLSFKFLRHWVGPPFRDLQVYIEYGAESIHEYMLRSIANLWGAYLDLGPVDLRFEWASLQNQTAWYIHYIYQSGYTYKGRIIGHQADHHSDVTWTQLSVQPIPRLRVSFWWENLFRKVEQCGKMNNAFGLEARVFLPKRVELFLSGSYTSVERWYVEMPDDLTEIWDLRARASVTF